MEKGILWFLLVLGIALFIFSLRKQPIKDWILSFLLTAYFAIFIGTIVADLKLVQYPVNLFGSYFSSSLLFEFVLFPVVTIYFYQTSHRSRMLGITFQCVVYTGGLTIVEALFQRYTDLVEYVHWSWTHTFLSVFCFLFAVRLLLKFINQISNT